MRILQELLMLPVVVAIWHATVFHISFASGWRKLAQRFPALTKPTARIRTMKSGSLNGVRYGNCLIVGIGNDGLYLAVFPLFALGHSPLLIPWNALSPLEKVRFQFNWQYQTTISLSENERMTLGIHNAEVAAEIEKQRAKAALPQAFSLS